MIEMSIESIRVSLMNYNRVVVLKEKGSERYLPIWIGAAEADAIAVRLQGVSVARPMTHDLLSNVLKEFGSRVLRVVVNDLSNDTFFARIYLDLDGSEVEVDSRPSDAIAIAVRNEAPIFVEDSVLDQAGVTIDANEEVGVAEGTEAQRPAPPVDEEELKRMSAFRDFIESLDLDDFDKRKS